MKNLLSKNLFSEESGQIPASPLSEDIRKIYREAIGEGGGGYSQKGATERVPHPGKQKEREGLIAICSVTCSGGGGTEISERERDTPR